jgi:cellulose synthase (UDP-forming)
MGLLAAAGVIGLVRMAVGQADVTPTVVNLLWIVFDLVVLSVIVQAVRYRPEDEPAAEAVQVAA